MDKVVAILGDLGHVLVDREVGLVSVVIPVDGAVRWRDHRSSVDPVDCDASGGPLDAERLVEARLDQYPGSAWCE